MDLVGRSDESGVIDAQLAAARAQQSQTLVIRGPAGIGKTALVEYAVASAHDFLVVQLTGFEAERNLGYAALRRLLTPILHQVERLPAPQRDALNAALGVTSGPGSDPFLVGLGVISLANNAARARDRLLCVIDDAQWVDRESLEALAFWGRRMPAEGIALILAARDGPDPVPALDGFPTMQVDGLADEAAHALLAAETDSGLDRRLADRIVVDTGGNPLALIELTNHLTAHALAEAASRPEPLPLQYRLEEHFMAQVRALPSTTQTILRLAAADSSNDPALLGRAAALVGVGVDDAEPAETAGLLTLGQEVRFRHPLVRSAIYTGASMPERRAAHRALAAASGPEDDEERWAWHRAAATIGIDDEVAAVLEGCADVAASRGSHTARTALLIRAAELTNEHELAAARRVDAAESALMGGSIVQAAELLAMAEPSLRGPAMQARAQRLNGRVLAIAARTTEAAPVLFSAASILVPVDNRAGREVLLEALEAALQAGSFHDRNVEVALAGAELAAATADGGDTVVDRLLDGIAAKLLSGYEAAVPQVRSVVAAIHDVNTPDEQLARWMLLLTSVCRLVWDDESWDVLQRRVAESSRQRGDLIQLMLALQAMATTATWAGRPGAADRYLAEAGDIAHAVGLDPLHSVFLGLDVLALRGAPEARAKAANVFALAEQHGIGISATLAHFALAQLDVAEGRYDDALHHAQTVVGSQPFGYSNEVLPDLIEAAVRAGRKDVASEALAMLREQGLASGSRWALGLVARSRALVVGADGEADYLEAISLLDSTRMAIDTARARLLYGEWLRRQKRRGEARDELRRAHEMFSAMGVAAFAERARVELLATGERARKRTVEAANDLTPQEAIIAGMAATGATNAEIAAQMYLSTSTVDYHLRKVFRKLSVTFAPSAERSAAGRRGRRRPRVEVAGERRGARRSIAGSGGLDEAAIDDEVGSGHVGGAFRGEQHDQGRHLLGRGEPSRGEPADAGHDVVPGGVGVDPRRSGHGRGDPLVAQPEVGPNRSGRDGGDPNALGTELLGQ